ncbi:isoprenoid biosynthesis glyoxalase ElbB [Endozoicomonas sp. SM1973]|uniref:Glyoxalase n=1 Tax=Spartinivicinus marinus TaxID=2994442 RepID=A0A853I9B2_9GAMM|nr:isoprenoid biosynthesis glyoxalase ElbB [Spartinivicinus marinus]MCX4027141.1 isoprenoid biosynthesis glyoxalase ElbB [Spartinivicinus marinus]NYZ66137.1 isoprenoid biosynthesis glyoxalase ElbB [Spartinivicinus marinus]
MAKKVAVILSGCGFLDGAEIHESILTLLNLDLLNVNYQCFAVDIEQTDVINHLTGEATPEKRNVLVESARIARGNIKDISQLATSEFDALILPGGYGVAKNLSNFAAKGAAMDVPESVLRACQSFATNSKPIGLICIAPALASKIYGDSVICTIGNDEQTAAALEEMGAQHQSCAVSDIVVDEKHRLVTTPAYMLANRISEAAEGITKLVKQVIALI